MNQLKVFILNKLFRNLGSPLNSWRNHAAPLWRISIQILHSGSGQTTSELPTTKNQDILNEHKLKETL
jgi:hypothetical protein